MADSEEAVEKSVARPRVVHEFDRKLEVQVTVPGGMTPKAEERFAKFVREFGVSLARETSRLEEAGRASGEEDPEIITSMVVAANEAVRNPQSEIAPVAASVIFSQVVVVPTGIVSGVFGSYLNSVWQVAGCVVFGVAALVAQTHAVVALRRRK